MEMERDDKNIISLQSAQTDSMTDDCASLPPFNQQLCQMQATNPVSHLKMSKIRMKILSSIMTFSLWNTKDDVLKNGLVLA